MKAPSACNMPALPDVRQWLWLWAHRLRCSCFMIWVILNNFYCIPTYLTWMFLLLPVRLIRSKLYWYIESVLFKWLLAMVAGWIWAAGYKIYELGHNLMQCLDDESLLLINHQSSADVPLLMFSFQNKDQVVGRELWIMWHILKYFNFGWVSMVHGDFFIKEGKEQRGFQLQLLSEHLKKKFYPRDRKWIVLFPEGGFLSNRRETSQRYALKNNLPVLQHVTLPRVGAVHAILETLSSKNHMKGNHNSPSKCLKWIIDVTVAYPNGEPISILNIVSASGPPCNIYLYYRVYPVSSIPLNIEEVTKWLYDRFAEKEALLDKFYKKGSFPNSEGHCKQVTLNNCWLLCLHIFFILSSAFHIFLFKMFFSG